MTTNWSPGIWWTGGLRGLRKPREGRRETDRLQKARKLLTGLGCISAFGLFLPKKIPFFSLRTSWFGGAGVGFLATRLLPTETRTPASCSQSRTPNRSLGYRCPHGALLSYRDSLDTPGTPWKCGRGPHLQAPPSPAPLPAPSCVLCRSSLPACLAAEFSLGHQSKFGEEVTLVLQ